MTLFRVSFAVILSMACTLSNAAGLTGLWLSDKGDFFLLSRDSLAAYGVQVGAGQLDIKDVWVGSMIASRVDYSSLDRSKRLTAALRNGKLTGQLINSGVVSDFSAALIQPWMGGKLDGIWKKDGVDGYLIVFNADDGSQGVSIVSDIDFSAGMPIHRIWLGKQIAGTFADVDSVGGLRLTLPSQLSGKLSGAYVEPDAGVELRLSQPDEGMPGYMPVAPAVLDSENNSHTRGTRTATATASTSAFTATQVSKTSDPDALSASRNTVPEETKKGCEGLFGKVQKDLSDQFLAEMESGENGGQTPGKIVSAYVTGSATVFDGGTVPLYTINIASDVRHNIEPFILKQAQTQNGFVECKVPSGDLISTYGLSATDYVGFDQAAAQASCSQLDTQAKELALTYAAFSSRGLQPTSIGFSADYTASGYPTIVYSPISNMIRIGINLDTDGTFPVPTDNNGVRETATDTLLIDRCKTELVKADIAFNGYSNYVTYQSAPATYPSWAANKPTGTAEQLFCMNPSFINPVKYPNYTEPTGMLAVDLGSASAVLRVKVDPATKDIVKFAGTGGNVDVLIPHHGYYEPTGFKASTFIATSSVKCGYDSMAAEWFYSAASKACELLPSSLTAQIGEQAYAAMKKTSSADNMNSLDRMADGMGKNLAATLGALKVGGFAPKTTVKDKNFLSTANVYAAYGYDTMKSASYSASSSSVVQYAVTVPYCPNL